MSEINTAIRRIYQQISKEGLNISSSQAYRQAKQYVNSLSQEDKELLESKGAQAYQSGDAFVQNIIETIKENLESQAQKENLENDSSIFSMSMEDVEKMDLSQEAIEKKLNENKDITDAINQEQEAQSAQGEESDAAPPAAPEIDENEEMFMQFMQALYSDELMKGVINADGDDTISNEEAQNFLKNLNIDGDLKNLTMNDVHDFFNKINGLPTEKEEWEQLEKESIEKGQGPADLPQTSQGISSNPYAPSYGSYTPSYSSSGAMTGGTQSGSMSPKNDLEKQIEEYKEQIAAVNDGTDSEIKEQMDLAEQSKVDMEEAIEQDEKLDEEQKEQAKELMENLSEVDSQIADVDSQIVSLQQELSAGEASLSSLESSLSSIASAPSTGNSEADKQVQQQIEARKQELQSQIDAQKQKNEALKEQIAQLEEQKATLEEQKATLEEGGQEDEMNLEKLKEMVSEDTQNKIDAYQEQTQAVNEKKVEKTQDLTEKLNAAQAQLQEIETQENKMKDEQCQKTPDAQFEEMLGFVLGVEGGLSNNPNDRGGLTNLGITQGTYTAWLNSRGESNRSVENITVEEAKEIYYNNYYVASGAQKYANEGNVAYAYALFDASVNHGVGGAANLDAQAQGDLDAFMEARIRKYQNIIANNPSQEVFRRGWTNRVNKLAMELGLNKTYQI